MEIEVSISKEMLGQAAARKASSVIRAAIKAQGEACVVAATGTPQFEFLKALICEPNIDGSR